MKTEGKEGSAEGLKQSPTETGAAMESESPPKKDSLGDN